LSHDKIEALFRMPSSNSVAQKISKRLTPSGPHGILRRHRLDSESSTALRTQLVSLWWRIYLTM
jgi:hypothetical protein